MALANSDGDILSAHNATVSAEIWRLEMRFGPVNRTKQEGPKAPSYALAIENRHRAKVLAEESSSWGFCSYRVIVMQFTQ